MVAITPVRVARDPDMFDVRDGLRYVLDAVRYNKWILVASVLLTLVLVTVYIHLWPPIYKAQASLMAEPDVDPVRDAYYGEWDIFRKDDPRTEVQLITSASVLRAVINKEHLSYDDVYHPFLSQLRYLWMQSWIGNEYRAAKKFILRTKPDPDAPTPQQLLLAQTIVDMGAGISVQPVGDTRVATLTMKGPTRRVAEIANSVINEYMVQRDTRHYDEALASYNALNKEVDLAKTKLDAASEQRVEFASKHHLDFDLSKQIQEVKGEVDLEAQIGIAKARAAQLAATVHDMEARLKDAPATIRVSTQTELNPVREAAKSKRLELQMSLLATESRFTDSAPEVKEIKSEIAKLDDVISGASPKIESQATEGLNGIQQDLMGKINQYSAELAGTTAELRSMENTLADSQRRLNDVPALQQKIRNLDREYDLAQQFYQALLMKRVQTKVSLGTVRATMPSIRIVDYAVKPGEKWWPMLKLLYPAAILAGLALGVIAAIIKTQLDARVRGSQFDTEALPLYSTIPVATSRPPLMVVGVENNNVQSPS